MTGWVSVVDRLLGVAESCGGAAAVVCGDGVVSFGEFGALVGRVAGELAGLGVGRGDRVGIVGVRGVGMVVGVWGVWRAGAAFVPLDPELPAARLAVMVADAGVSVVVGPAGGDGVVEGLGCRVVRLGVDGSVAESAGAAAAGAGGLPVGASDAAYVLFTSGSTGRPKGVVVDHGGVAGLVDGLAGVVPQLGGLRVSVNASLAFDACVQQLVQLVWGSCLVMVEEEVRRDPELMVRFLRQARVDVLDCTPTQLRGLVRAGVLSEGPSVVLVGGEALDQRLWDELRAASDVRAVNVYGLTECSVDSTAAVVGWSGPVPCVGRPLVKVRAFVVDAAGALVGPGVVGELWLGGAGVAQGYAGDPVLTASRFVPDGFAGALPGSRLMRTGDLVQWQPDGSLVFVCRADGQVKVRGYRVELAEIEHALLGHTAVEQAAVVARADASGNTRLTAYITAMLDDSRDTDENVHSGRSSQWQAIFEASNPDSQRNDPRFDTRGWNSSYTGLRYDDQTMRAWLDATVTQLLAQAPRKVLEIGCGTGLILFRLAPHSESYTGLDFSVSVLDHIRAAVAAGAPVGPGLRLVQGSAEDVAELCQGSYDLIVMNSVAQYLSSLDHLRQTIDRALSLLAPSGVMYIGDVCSAPLAYARHASIRLFRARSSQSAAELRKAVEQAVHDDPELAVDPVFFTMLADHDPRVTAASVHPRRGTGDDEMTRYRYDVWLRTSGTLVDAAWLDWGADIADLPALRERIGAARGAVLGIRAVPNSRVSADVALAERLTDEQSEDDVQILRTAHAANRAPRCDPALMAELAADAGLHARSSWARGAEDGSFDVAFGAALPDLDQLRWPTAPDPAARSMSNNPMRRTRNRRLHRDLQVWLASRLPEQMRPSALVFLDRIPRTTSGKIDRAALLDLDAANRRPAADDGLAPTDRSLFDILAEVLEHSDFGLDDAFFAVGGDSLRSLEVITLIRHRLSVQVSLAQFMACKSIRELRDLVASPHAQVPATLIPRRSR
ncbi:amino acid adenylation domain-containing protein [Nonomuraea sp. NPDC050556]|uniref:amino acid adenylation domain-containing protein n=1 Tax=Nonomuraea sp. NPDC050556 TaxID=3364369 RepID=UPI0037A943D6